MSTNSPSDPGNTNSGRSATDKARSATSGAVEEIKLAGNQLVDRVRTLVEEGNVRRIVVKKDEKVLLEVPLTIAAGAGAAVVLLSPVLAALGALAALITDVTLVVERHDDAAQEGGRSAARSGGQAPAGSPATGASGEPTKTPASKQETDKEGAGGGGSADKTIGR